MTPITAPVMMPEIGVQTTTIKISSEKKWLGPLFTKFEIKIIGIESTPKQNPRIVENTKTDRKSNWNLNLLDDRCIGFSSNAKFSGDRNGAAFVQ